MSDILFISPNVDANENTDSIGTYLLSTILHSYGLESKIISLAHLGPLENFPVFLEQAVQTLCAENPKIISFYTRCDNYHIVLALCEALRKHTDAYIVFGGPQSDLTAYATISSIPYVDFICCGEGENTVYPFFRSLLDGKPDLSVPGLVYKDQDKVVVNPRPALLQDLDSLPYIDYSLYDDASAGRKTDAFQVDVGRGCPFACTYCSTKTFWGRKYRLKSPKRIVDEIEHAYRNLGSTLFVFDHDMFTMDRKKVIETCRLIKQLNLPIKWKCSARIDCIDESLIDIMVDAGMVSIFIGIETGSPRMQTIINKKLKLDNVVELLTYIDTKCPTIIASFVYGFPEENEEDLSATIALMRDLLRLKHVRVTPHLCTFLPGTELTTKYLSQLTPAENFSNITGGIAMAECAELIRKHPAIFPHFWEYKTPMRSRLEFFDQFIIMWKYSGPIYDYISRRYAPDRLIDMYYDFTEQNREILNRAKDLPSNEQYYYLFGNDCMLSLVRDDPYINVLRDIHKILAVRHFGKKEAWKTKTDIYCLSPYDVHAQMSVQSAEQKPHVVTYTKDDKNRIRMFLRNI